MRPKKFLTTAIVIAGVTVATQSGSVSLSSFRPGDKEPPALGDDTKRRPIQTRYGGNPLYFIQNNGQMDEKVKFYEKGSGHAFFFAQDGIYISLQEGAATRSQSNLQGVGSTA